MGALTCRKLINLFAQKECACGRASKKLPMFYDDGRWSVRLQSKTFSWHKNCIIEISRTFHTKFKKFVKWQPPSDNVNLESTQMMVRCLYLFSHIYLSSCHKLI